tara:strand:+ start:449 stop:757 length:309 start_codon:yes stop_codon:yes gene_type:complete
MSKKIRKNSVSSNSNESISTIDSRSYSTDKSRSNSLELHVDITNITDLSNNKNNWVIPIAKKEPKRRKRDMHINNENISTTPVINYDYLNFQHFTVLESTNK